MAKTDYRKFMPYAVLASCLLLTAYAWHATSSYTTEKVRERFISRTDHIIYSITGRIYSKRAILQGGAALFAANKGNVSREQWRTYVENLRLSERYAGIQGVGFSRLIRPSELKSHIAKIRAEGFPAYTVRPEGMREVFTSIIYLEPFDRRNQRAFGYDMFSEAVRRAAMEKARDSGMASMSGKVKLLQETEADVQAGFLIYVPVYKEDMPVKTVQQRREALLGYVYSPFRIKDLMNALFRGELGDIDLEIYDGGEISETSFMYDLDDKKYALYGDNRRLFSIKKTIEIHGHNWTLFFSSLPDFETFSDRHLPRGILISGIIISILIFLLLLSVEKAREQALETASAMRKAKYAAESATKAKSDFLANMSHELRTPLNSVIGFSEILLDGLYGGLNKNQKEYVNDIYTSGQHLLSLINDILDLSKVEAGKMELELNRFMVSGLLRSSLSLMKEKAMKHAISLDLEITPELNVEIEADERKLKQIVFNLLSNAVKFTPEGGSVRVGARKYVGAALCGCPKKGEHTGSPLQDRDFIEITVEDTGIGIKPEDITKLFSEFTQLESAYTKQYEGTGLGLALTKKLVELQGGKIWVESEFGKGSKFTFVIPIRQAQEADS